MFLKKEFEKWKNEGMVGFPIVMIIGEHAKEGRGPRGSCSAFRDKSLQIDMRITCPGRGGE